MSLLLRSSLLQQSKNYFRETQKLGRNYIFCKSYKYNHFKRTLPDLQELVLNDGTKSQKYSQEKHAVIYNGTLKKQIRSLKIFSLGTSICGLAIQPFIISKAIKVDSTAGIVGAIIIAVFSIASPLLLNLITKRYVTSIYYDSKEEKYTATTYSLFLRQNKIEFTPADVKVPDVTGIFTVCFIKGKPIFFDDRLFNDHDHYIKIMGFDKPVDYKLKKDNYNVATIENDLSEKAENKR